MNPEEFIEMYYGGAKEKLIKIKSNRKYITKLIWKFESDSKADMWALDNNINYCERVLFIENAFGFFRAISCEPSNSSTLYEFTFVIKEQQ